MLIILQGHRPPFLESVIALLLLGLLIQIQQEVQGYPCCDNKDCSSTRQCDSYKFCDYRENLDGYASFGCLDREHKVEECFNEQKWLGKCITFTEENITEAKEKLKGCFNRYGVRDSDIQYSLGLLQPGIRITCLDDRCNHCKGPATTTIPTTTPTPTTDTDTSPTTTRTTTRKRSTTTRRIFRDNVGNKAGQHLKPEWNLTFLLIIPPIVRAILTSF